MNPILKSLSPESLRMALILPAFGGCRRHCLVWAYGCLAAAWIGLGATPVEGQTYDAVIRHGRVVDGTGNPAFFADVAIHEGKIAAVGRVEGKGQNEVDATGLVVAPGFIDVHTHADDLDEMPEADNFARMGVTTVLAGNCGSSALDLEAVFGKIELARPSINFATLVGHGSVRRRVMGGSFDREPTAAELEEMQEHVARAMQAGAVGLSTGLIYLPGTFSRTEELIAMAAVAAAYDGVYATHMRNEGEDIRGALAEVFEIARATGIRGHVSHIKLSGKANWGQADAVLAAIEGARAEGLDITQDQYLYTASSTGISQLIPESAREGDRLKERLADPAQKTRIVAEMKARLKRGLRKDYSYAVISHYAKDPSLNGLNVAEAARKARGSGSLKDQIELILEIQCHGGATGVFHGISEEDLVRFWRHPNTMAASDSGLRRLGEGTPHPRGYGNNARALTRYVRELKVVRLEDAVRRMTSLPASVFRLEDRGAIRPGAFADLVVFNPETVQDRATYRQPHQYATGFARVYVNGQAVVIDDAHTHARPGRVLRHRGP